MNKRGFTIVELLVVIIVMAILLTLAVVNVRSTQAQARDNERRVDVENIAAVLESFYAATHSGSWRETYPGTTEMGANQSSYAGKFLAEKTGNGSLHAPDVAVTGNWSIVLATNTNQTTTGVTPAPTIATYVYQPLTASNQLCTTLSSRCVKYNIFYKTERSTSDCPAPNNICKYRSKRQ